LKMADELTRPPYNRPSIVPSGLDRPSLVSKEGEALEIHYWHILDECSSVSGMLDEMFRRAKPAMQNQATLRRMAVDPTATDTPVFSMLVTIENATSNRMEAGVGRISNSIFSQFE